MSAGKWSNPTSDQIEKWDRQHVWHAFTQMAEYEPFVIDRAEGCLLFDRQGNSYVDGVSSIWCNLHGHQHPLIDQALRDQLDRVAHVTSLGMSNSVNITLARRLCELAPNGLEHVFFSGDGSSAVEVAIKMAYQYWQQRPDPRPRKTKYIAFADAYHGDTLGSASVGGIERFHRLFDPLLFDVIHLPIPQTYRVAETVPSDGLAQHYLDQLEEALRQHHEQTAAIVIEPLVQCAAGMVTHPTGFLHGVRELSRRYGVLLIADEVAVGFGRTGKLFACEHENVEPDFLCLAKGLTGGYLAMAATLTTTEIWNAFLGSYAESKTFFHGHTYGGNPLAAAAGHATLDIFDSENTLSAMSPKVEQLSSALNELAQHPLVGDTRQVGLIGCVELVANKQTKEPFHWERRIGLQVCQTALKHGVWLRPLGSVIVIMPPLSISADQLKQITDAIKLGIDAL